MTLEELDALVDNHLDSMDVLRDIETIIQSRHPHFKRFMSPLSLNDTMKELVFVSTFLILIFETVLILDICLGHKVWKSVQDFALSLPI